MPRIVFGKADERIIEFAIPLRGDCVAEELLRSGNNKLTDLGLCSVKDMLFPVFGFGFGCLEQCGSLVFCIVYIAFGGRSHIFFGILLHFCYLSFGIAQLLLVFGFCFRIRFGTFGIVALKLFKMSFPVFEELIYGLKEQKRKSACKNDEVQHVQKHL